MKFISECSLSKIISQLQGRERTPDLLIDELCDKIEKWDGEVKAFLPEQGRRERLYEDLRELHEQFPNPDSKPVLFGIPVGIKDIFHVDRFPTRAGSELPSEILKGDEAAAVTRLKKAGALILGKTVTTEFAYFHPGPTRNPHNFQHTPGGSSSGSAAAVAAGFCPLALGTQTIGSISRPASYCGVFGFKPNFGRIPTEGVIPFSSSADHVGFFTQDMEGCQIAASVLCDNWDTYISYSKKPPVLGIPKGDFLSQASQEVLVRFQIEIDTLRKAGLTIKEIPAFENIHEINNLHKEMIACEFARVHESWFNIYKDLYSNASKELIKKGNSVSQSNYEKAKRGMLTLRNNLMSAMEEFDVDLWISPSANTTALKGLESTGDPILSLPWTYAGLPTLSVPFGMLDGLPCGLQFAGKYNKDEILLQHLNKLYG